MTLPHIQTPGTSSPSSLSSRQDTVEKKYEDLVRAEALCLCEPQTKSRSQKKRESLLLQQHGQALSALSPAMLEKLPLSPELGEALLCWRGLKSREAKRRHMQYIGRLMREVDNPEELLSALQNMHAEASCHADRFCRCSSLRDELLHPSESVRKAALERIIVEFPSLERSRLLQLMEAALADREKKRPPRHARRLFRYLQDGRIA